MEKEIEIKIEKVKEKYKDRVILVKKGIFLHGYGNDAQILGYLMGYKILEDNGQIYSSFPCKSSKKVQGRLDDNKVGYVIVDKQQGYIVTEESESSNKQIYLKILEKSKKYVENKTKIDKVEKFLNEIIETREFNGIVSKLEKILDES